MRFQTIEEFKAYLESQWDDHGECKSCGWKALPYEYGTFDDSDLPEEGDYKQGFYWLPCIGEWAEEGGHRGVRIPLPPDGGRQ